MSCTPKVPKLNPTIKSFRKAALAAVSVALIPAMASGAVLTAADLTTLVKDSPASKNVSDVRVVGSGPSVTVLAQKDSKAEDKDLKIDAVFIAKVLIDGAPGQIESVKVLFSQAGRNGRYILISRKNIEDYGHGKLSPDLLLSSLKLVSMEQDRGPEIEQGPEMERRLLVWQRIEKLRQQGTGVKPFEMIFREIEGLAKSGDAGKTSQKIAYIETKLTEQEEQVKQAKKAAQGRGISARTQASSSSPSSTSSSQQPAVPAAGGGAIVPPHAAQLKAVYTREADTWLRQISAKNTSSGQKAVQLKQRIDQCFAEKRDAEAYQTLHLLQTLLMQITGYDPFAQLGPANPAGQSPPQTASGNSPGQGNRQSSGSSVWGQPTGGGGFPGGQGGGPPGMPGGGMPGGGMHGGPEGAPY